VLDQAQQRGPGGHQRSAHLLLGQPVQAATELTAVLIEEHLELDPGWLSITSSANVTGREDMHEAFQGRRSSATSAHRSLR